ncbi:flippase [Flavobacterium soyangense]|uniref:Flippase n=1 Tax=Flavobacterium soyangense TaxID=2023265 RepID=A0A930UD35_9FLAO|nr:flippase [Flavobacterium soyangense]MBF2708205.1 flippase [Flavobacterium soyangense]
MSLIKNYFYNTLLLVTNVLYPLITFPYIARVIGPEGTGKLAFIMSIVQYFVIVAALGIPAYGVREIARLRDNKEKRDKLFNELVTINIINSVVLSFFYLLLLFLVPKLEVDFKYFLISILFVLFSFTNVDWFFTGIEEFRLITIRNVIVKLLSIVLLFIFVNSKADFGIYFGLTFLGLFINNFINFYYLKDKIKFSFTINYSLHSKPLLLLFATIFATSIYVLMDTIILGFLTNSLYVGYYNASMRLYKAALPIVTSLGVVMLPRMSIALEKNDMPEYNKLIEKSISFHFFVSLPISLFIGLFSSELIMLFAGKQFIASIPTTQILAPLIIIVGLSNILILQILNTMRMEKYMLFSVLIGSITSLVFNFILIPFLYQNGAAWATFITEVVVCLMLGYYVFFKTSIRICLTAFWQGSISLIPFIFFYFLFHDFFLNMFLRLGIISILGMTFYILILHKLFKNEFIIAMYNLYLFKFRLR